MKYQKPDYVARISVATPIQLVIINYELVIGHITYALDSQENNSVFEHNIKQAMDSLGYLMDTLNMNYEISKSLMSIYIYANKLLIQSKTTGKPEYLIEARSRLSELLDSWLEVEKSQPNSAAVMENAQQLYAGLTYGKGELKEYVEESSNRGYKI